MGNITRQAPDAWGTSAADPVELLERSRHLSFLHDAFVRAVGDSYGRLLLITGEAGVGKTQLIRHFCEDHRSGNRVLWGACDPLFTPRPLGPFIDVAQAIGKDFKSFLEGDPRPHEVAAALVRILRTGPSILVLEDLNWADEATLDVLRLLARRLERVPAIVIATYRDDELSYSHPLRIVLGDLADAVTRLVVEPLSSAAVEDLARKHNLDADDLYQKTAGNAFFVMEAIASGKSEIPATVRDAVLARAARLSEPARRLLEAVAIVPPRAETWLLDALQVDAVERLDECLSSGIIRADGGAIAFRHELARLVILDSISPVRRAILHRAALRALRDRPRGVHDFARLAHHAEAADDTAAVLQFAAAAAEQAAKLGAHREAAAQYERVLRYADQEPLEVQAELLERCSFECFLTDRSDGAIEKRERALALYRELGDRVKEGDSLRWLSRLVSCRGRISEALELGHASVDVLESCPPGRELARAYGHMAAEFADAEDSDGALYWGPRAIELAERFHDIETVVHSLNSMGLVGFLAERPEGRERLERSLELALKEGLDEHAARAFIHLAWGASRIRAHELLDEYVRQGLEYSRERGLDLCRTYLLVHGARADLDRCRWSDAVAAAERVLEDRLPSTLPRTLALVTLALARVRRGERGYEPMLEEALALAQFAGELQWIAPVAAARAEVSWLEGNDGAIVDVTEKAFELSMRNRAPWLIGELASWRRRAGEREELTVEASGPYVLQIAGDPEGAGAWWDRLGWPYEAALARSDSDDIPTLRRCLENLHGLGARGAAVVVAQRLRKLGANVPRGPRLSTQRNPANLTGRELEVLQLLAEGLRDRKIAERLFISEKTVSHHVSSILGKLGVASRAQATVEWTRLAGAPPR